MGVLRRTLFANTAVVAALGVTLAACGSSSSSSSSASAPKTLTPITVLEAGSLPGRMPFYVALYGGIFQKYGLKAQLSEAASGSQVGQLLAGGKAQFGLGQVTDALGILNGGEPVSAVAMLSDKLENTIIVGEQYAGKIKTLSDLANQPIGITALGSGTQQFADYSCSLGKVPDSECDLTAVGSTALTSGQDLVSGRLVATVTGDPAAVALVGEGKAKYLLDSLDPTDSLGKNYPQFLKLAEEPFIFTWAYGSKSYIDSHKKVTQEFVDALQAARNYIFTHTPAQTAKLLVQVPEFTAFGTKYLAQTVIRLRDTSKSLPTSLVIPQINFTNTVAYASQVANIYGKDHYADVVDNSFANSAAKTVGTASKSGP